MSTTPIPSPEPAASAEDLRLVLPGRVAPIGAGWDWVVGGWRLFVRAPLMWIISIVLVFICFVAVSLVPILGHVVSALLQPVVLAGYLVACHSLERGGEFELDHLLAGFKRNFGNLVVVGLLFLIGEIVILLIFIAFVLMTVGSAILAGGTEQMVTTLMGSIVTFLVGLLITLGLALPLMAAYWFAPALVILNNVQPVEAMKASFSACFRNFFPFLVYSVILFVLMILAAIPFGLGLLVLIPMILAGIYVSYRDIFTEEPVDARAKPTFA